MKTIQDQLSTYKSVHLSKKNIMTHFIGVPLIIWSLLVLLSLIRLPVQVPILEQPLTLSMLFFMVVLIYYLLLNLILALTAIVLLTPIFYSSLLTALFEHAAWIAIGVFVAAWIIQFIGHHYEKAKPAFVDDINQLLIGPLFLIAEIIFTFGGLKSLEKEIEPMAIDKRRAFEKAKG